MSALKRINLLVLNAGFEGVDFKVIAFIAIVLVLTMISAVIGNSVYQGIPFFQRLYLDLVSVSSKI